MSLTWQILVGGAFTKTNESLDWTTTISLLSSVLGLYRQRSFDRDPWWTLFLWMIAEDFGCFLVICTWFFNGSLGYMIGAGSGNSL